MFIIKYYYFLVCTIEWMTPVHDGPVNMMLKSPFMDHLLLTMGGYSFAIWNEGIMVSTVQKKLFTPLVIKTVKMGSL